MVSLVQGILDGERIMKKIIGLLFITGLLITGCSNFLDASNTQLSISDAAEREIELKGFPKRIVIAGKQTPMLTNFFYMFESAPDKIAAIENRSQSKINFFIILDPENESKYLLEKGAGVEQIAPLNPDLIILKTSMRETIGSQMEKIGMPVVYLEFETIDQTYRDIRTIAYLLNESSRGEEIITRYQEIFEDISGKISDTSHENSETVLLIQAVGDSGGYTFSVPSRNWLQTQLVELAGGDPVWTNADQGGGWTEVNFEQISVWDPDHIFIINYQGQSAEIVDNLYTDELWLSLSAGENEQISAFPYDYISWDQPDPRWLLGFLWISYEIHPDIVTGSDLEIMISEFYSFFYNLDEEFIKDNILPIAKVYIR